MSDRNKRIVVIGIVIAVSSVSFMSGVVLDISLGQSLPGGAMTEHVVALALIPTFGLAMGWVVWAIMHDDLKRIRLCLCCSNWFAQTTIPSFVKSLSIKRCAPCESKCKPANVRLLVGYCLTK